MRRAGDPPAAAPGNDLAGARAAATRAARTSYGRLVALLAARGGNLAAAEDALAEALAAALATWPVRGVPDNPDAWLFTAARRSLGAARARGRTADASEPTLALLDDERAAAGEVPFGDERLKLLFVCTHPAIDPAVQAPLMLQTVLGLDADRIAARFLVSPAAMGQRLVRAKRRIRETGIAFVIPDADRLHDRVAAVLAAIYAAYGSAHDSVDGGGSDLAEEAIWLARLVRELLPDEPEADGLLALMLFCEARRPARRDAGGAYLPLGEQDWRRWHQAPFVEAEGLLRAAARRGRPGRFQIEAAIQSLHAQGVITGAANPAALTALYDLLIAVAPTIGARIGRAAARAAIDPAAALADLDTLATRCAAHQPWWATRAHVLALAGDSAGARAAATTAAGLATDRAVRDWLLARYGGG